VADSRGESWSLRESRFIAIGHQDYERSVVVRGGIGVCCGAGCDATERFFVSVAADFSASHAKAGATATARSMVAIIRRVIGHSPVGWSVCS